MSIEYRFRFTEEHLLSSFLRYRQQIWWRRPFIGLKAILTTLIALLMGLSIWKGSVVLSGIFGGILGMSLLGWPIDAWFVRRRFRKSPFHNDEIVFSLSEDGTHVIGLNSEVRAGWEVFTKARRFKDGMLLFKGPSVFNWLPDSAICPPSNISNVQDLVRTRVIDYREI